MPLFGKPNVDKLKAKRDTARLVEALSHSTPEVRIAAADALGELRDPASSEALTSLLADEDDDVRRAAARVLQEAGWEPTELVERARYLACLGDWLGIVDLGPDATAILIEQLRRLASDQGDELVGAYFTLSGPEGTTTLFVERPAGGEEDRGALVAALAGVGLPAVDGLIDALQDENASVVAHASWALIEIGEPALRSLLDRYLAADGSASGVMSMSGIPILVRNERWLGPMPTMAAIAKAVHEGAGSNLAGYVSEGTSWNLEGLRLVAGIAEDADMLDRLNTLGGAAEDIDGADGSVDQEWITRCLEPAFVEQEEPRNWQSEPAFATVLDPLNRGDHRTAAKAAEELAGRYPDLDLAYAWWGSALRSLGDLDRAREVLGEGLAKANRKFFICGRLGEVEAASGDLREAVYHWAQAIHCQERLEGRGGEVGPYLHLHYVADGTGEEELATAFLRRVDEIRAGQVRLEPSAAAELRVLAARQEGVEVDEVLAVLGERYLN